MTEASNSGNLNWQETCTLYFRRRQVMSIRYGKPNCKHLWAYRKNGYEEGCHAIVCLKCGAFGCICDLENQPLPPVKDGVKGNANIGGNWENPYVKKDEAVPVL